MWQKARIVNINERDTDIPIGTIVFVAGPPVEMTFADRFNNQGTLRAFKLNLKFPPTPDYDGPAFMRAECVELLPEFADDVPLISWQDFLEGKE